MHSTCVGETIRSGRKGEMQLRHAAPTLRTVVADVLGQSVAVRFRDILKYVAWTNNLIHRFINFFMSVVVDVT